MRGLTLTVSQLNEYVRRSLASDPMLHGLCLTGELSNFKRHTSGHWYFTLKDEEAAINCAMFRQAAMGVRFRPENGQRVRLLGSVDTPVSLSAIAQIKFAFSFICELKLISGAPLQSCYYSITKTCPIKRS